MKTLNYVIIGDEFASQLGYEHLVGAMGIIDEVMSALCRVTLISGNPEYIGTQEDIHVEDCIYPAEEAVEPFIVLIHHESGKIYYTRDRDLAEHVKTYVGKKRFRVMHNVRHLHEALDVAMEDEHLKYKPRSFFSDETEIQDYTVHPMEDEQDEIIGHYVRQYRSEKEYEKMREVPRPRRKFGEPIIDSSSLLSSLAEQFQKQLEATQKSTEITLKRMEKPIIFDSHSYKEDSEGDTSPL